MPDLSILPFASQEEFELWLSKNHASFPGIWLRFFPKASATLSVRPQEAVDVALCYGWIDSQLKKDGGESWLHRYSPRKPKSIWSKRNRENVARLIKEKRMRPPGLKEVEAAKKDGRWDRAYDAPSTMIIPEDFLKELCKNDKAHAFFKSLNKANIYAIAWRLQTAKTPETRANRMQKILAMLKRGEKFH